MKRIFSAVLLFMLLVVTVVALNKVDAESVQQPKSSSSASIQQ